MLDKILNIATTNIKYYPYKLLFQEILKLVYNKQQLEFDLLDFYTSTIYYVQDNLFHYVSDLKQERLDINDWWYKSINYFETNDFLQVQDDTIYINSSYLELLNQLASLLSSMSITTNTVTISTDGFIISSLDPAILYPNLQPNERPCTTSNCINRPVQVDEYGIEIPIAYTEHEIAQVLCGHSILQLPKVRKLFCDLEAKTLTLQEQALVDPVFNEQELDHPSSEHILMGQLFSYHSRTPEDIERIRKQYEHDLRIATIYFNRDRQRLEDKRIERMQLLRNLREENKRLIADGQTPFSNIKEYKEALAS